MGWKPMPPMTESHFDKFVEVALNEDIEGMSMMLDAGFDVNAANERGETAFSFCCANNKIASAKFLFGRGANVNTVDAGGGTPLDWAVCWSSPQFRDWLAGIGGIRKASHEPWPWPLDHAE